MMRVYVKADTHDQGPSNLKFVNPLELLNSYVSLLPLNYQPGVANNNQHDVLLDY